MSHFDHGLDNVTCILQKFEKRFFQFNVLPENLKLPLNVPQKTLNEH